MSERDRVLVERDAGLVILTLSNPDRRNALSAAMAGELGKAARDAADDPTVRAVLLRGADGVFCSGGDLKSMSAGRDGDESGPASSLRAYYDDALALWELPVPCVAAMAGPAYGAGVALALTCDIRIAASDGRLALNFSRLGLHPGMASTWLVARTVGASRATELLMTGRTVGAREALDLGLVHEVVEPDELENRSRGLAARLAAGPTVALRLLKETMRGHEHADLGAVLEREVAAQSVTFATEDLAAGLEAFLTKTEPDFKGR